MTFIVAEAGVNHCGRLDLALELVAIASECGADAVKFQAFTPEKLSSDYQQRAMLKGLALTTDELEHIANRCKQQGIEFMCTAFDDDWLRYLLTLSIKRIKIASGQVLDTFHNRILLSVARSTGLPVILSLGLARKEEVVKALNALSVKNTSLLYCVSKYPTPDIAIRFQEMKLVCQDFPDYDVGFSSHAQSFWPDVAAVYAGAKIIEHHITTSRTLPGPDQSSSLEPAEVRAWVTQIRFADSFIAEQQ